MKSTLAHRLMLGTGAILLFALLALSLFIIHQTRKQTEALAGERRDALVTLLARSSIDGLAARDFELLDGLVRAMAQNREIAWIVIADRHGKVLASTQAEWIGKPFHPPGQAERRDSGIVALLQRPATIDGIPLGKVWVAFRQTPDPFSGRLPLLIASAALLALLFLIVSISLLVRRLTRPLEQLSQTLASVHLDALPPAGRVEALAHGASLEVAALARETEELIRRLHEARTAIAEEEERLQQAVEHRTAELRAINEELESFSYSVSHDLRAPLRAIDGFSRALEEDCGAQMDDEARDYLARIRRASQRMGSLIDSLLRLSRLSRSEMHLQKVDLSAMATAILQRLQQEQPEREVEWTVQDDLQCQCDPELMQVALENLLGNAWKYTRDRRPARIEVSGRLHDGLLEFCVRDNGVGFDKRHADRLFGAFQRLHGNEFEGSGIGLATVQRIVHRHHGSVRAEGQAGQGARFCLILPSSRSA